MGRVLVPLFVASLLLAGSAHAACPQGQTLHEERYAGTAKVSMRGCSKPLPAGRYSREGKWEEFYESGRKKADTLWKDDKKEGVSTWYFENGNKMWEFTYQADKMEGPSTEWAADGGVTSRAVYKNDNLVKSP